MKIFDKINNINFIYEDDTIININVKEKNLEDATEEVLYSTDSIIIKDFAQEQPFAEKYSSIDPYFILVKIYRPEHVKKIVFKNNNNVLYYVEYKGDLLKKSNLMRLVDVNESSPESLETFLHRLRTDAHLENIKNLIINLNNRSFINKDVLNEFFYKTDKSGFVNSNLITKDFQLFYFGTCTSKFMLDPNKNLSYRVDTYEMNTDININFFNEKNVSKFCLGD